MAGHMVNAPPARLRSSFLFGKIHDSLWLLGRQGIDSHLRIGIRKENDKFEAHAWVERDGAALNEPDEHHHHFAALTRRSPRCLRKNRERVLPHVETN